MTNSICNKGNLKPSSNSYDYSSYIIFPTTADLQSAPLIYAPKYRTNNLVSTLNKNAYAHSNLELSFGNSKSSFGNCKSPFFKNTQIGNLKPSPHNTLKGGIKQIQSDELGNLFITTSFGKYHGYKIKTNKHGKYFKFGNKTVYL